MPDKTFDKTFSLVVKLPVPYSQSIIVIFICDIQIRGPGGTSQQMKGTLIIRNEKSSRLSNSLVMSYSFQLICKCRSEYETDFILSVVSYIYKLFGVDARYKPPKYL